MNVRTNDIDNSHRISFASFNSSLLKSNYSNFNRVDFTDDPHVDKSTALITTGFAQR
jgi:hypothetical protein